MTTEQIMSMKLCDIFKDVYCSLEEAKKAKDVKAIIGLTNQLEVLMEITKVYEQEKS